MVTMTGVTHSEIGLNPPVLKSLACLSNLKVDTDPCSICHGDWGIIIVSDFPDSSDSLVRVGAFMHAGS